jgi:hypothetical protein
MNFFKNLLFCYLFCFYLVIILINYMNLILRIRPIAALRNQQSSSVVATVNPTNPTEEHLSRVMVWQSYTNYC